MRLPLKYNPLAGQQVRQTPGALLMIWFSFRTQKTFPFEGRARRSFPFARKNVSASRLCSSLFARTRSDLYVYLSLPSLFRYFSNYKLYQQLTTSSKLVRSFHGEAIDDVSVANTGILVGILMWQGNLAMRTSSMRSVLRIHNPFRGSTTAMVVRALKRALSHSEET